MADPVPLQLKLQIIWQPTETSYLLSASMIVDPLPERHLTLKIMCVPPDGTA
eukprot:gene1201-2948_t